MEAVPPRATPNQSSGSYLMRLMRPACSETLRTIWKTAMQPMPATRMAPPAPSTIDMTPEIIEGASGGASAFAAALASAFAAALAFAFAAALAFAFGAVRFWRVGTVDRCIRLFPRPCVGDKFALAPKTHRIAPLSARVAPRSMVRALVVRNEQYDTLDRAKQ